MSHLKYKKRRIDVFKRNDPEFSSVYQPSTLILLSKAATTPYILPETSIYAYLDPSLADDGPVLSLEVGPQNEKNGQLSYEVYRFTKYSNKL